MLFQGVQEEVREEHCRNGDDQGDREEVFRPGMLRESAAASHASVALPGNFASESGLERASTMD